MNIIAARQFEGDLYIKASDHHRVVRVKVEAEREECAKVCDVIDDGRKDLSAECAEAIRARGQDPMPLFDDWGKDWK